MSSSSMIRSASGHRRAEQGHDPLDQLLLEADDLGRLGAASGSGVRRREQLLDGAEGEPAVADRAADLAQRVAALAHPRDDARLRRGGRGPVAALDRGSLAGRPSASASTLGDAGAARRPR